MNKELTITDWLILGVVVLIAACIAGTYFYTKHMVFKEAYSKGIHHQDKTISDLKFQIDGNNLRIEELEAENKSLQDQYNQLKAKVQQYVADTSSSGPVRCTSNNFGNTTFTNCN